MVRSRKHYWLIIISASALFLGLASPTDKPLAQSGGNPGVIPLNAKPHGLSYSQWSAKWFQWAFELPADGHPFVSCPESISTGQSGRVWFLAGQPAADCAGTIPTGTALFFPLVNVDCSTLEDPPFHGDNEVEQRSCAKFFADHIVVASLFCEIDGVPVKNLSRYRVASPQFAFTAPTPWVFGAVGGQGTAVGDGYYLFLHPLSKGEHTIHFGGDFHFSIAEGDDFDGDFGFDTTYHLTVN